MRKGKRHQKPVWQPVVLLDWTAMGSMRLIILMCDFLVNYKEISKYIIEATVLPLTDFFLVLDTFYASKKHSNGQIRKRQPPCFLLKTKDTNPQSWLIVFIAAGQIRFSAFSITLTKSYYCSSMYSHVPIIPFSVINWSLV